MAERFSLEMIEVASPCPADWGQMRGDERVRHCGQCERHVYNLSAMSHQQAVELVTQHEGGLCVRFYLRSDGKVMTADCPRAVLSLAARIAWKKFAAAAVVMLMLSFGMARRSQPMESLRERITFPLARAAFDWVFPPSSRLDVMVMGEPRLPPPARLPSTAP